jgi:glycosyltransferase involved in cell wall biosynthesis
MTKKKICVIIGSLDVGGAEMDIVRNYPLINKTHDVLVLLYSHDGKLADQLRKTGVEVKTIKPFQSPSTIISILTKSSLFSLFIILSRSFWFLRSNIKKEKSDIIHAFLPLSYIYATLVKLSMFKNRPKLIMSRLSLNFYFAKHKVMAFIEKNICHKFVDVAVGNSKAILNDLKEEGLSEDKLFLLYNGIEVEKFKTTRSLKTYQNVKTLQITSVGNLFTYKGHGDLIKALKLVKARRPDIPWFLNVLGRDEEGNLEKYNTFLKENNLEHNVNFVGPSSDVVNFLKNSHLHIHPSHTEGLPNSIIEAMSSGLACIGTNVGGVPELINDNENGVIVEPKSPDSLASAIEYMLSDRERLHQYGEASYKKALSEFEVNISVGNYLELYK